jgi:hypothetical protein
VGDASPFILTLHFLLLQVFIQSKKILRKIYLWAGSKKISSQAFTLLAESVAKIVRQCG